MAGRRQWSREKVVGELLRRRAGGLAVNIAAILKSDVPLAGAIYSQFKSHDAALIAAGIEPASVRKNSNWDKERIVTALQSRRSAGLSLNCTAVHRSGGGLACAARAHFGSYNAALIAAGIEPALVRKAALPWDKTRILAALQARRKAGLALNTGAIQKSEHTLSAAIIRHFKSHDAALTAAGIEPALVRKQSSWDNAAILAGLRSRRKAGLSLNYAAIAKSDSRLYDAARHHFGSYNAALVAAGIEPASVRKIVAWDKAQILTALRARRKAGLAINIGAIQKSDGRLSSAIFSHFKSHDAALAAIGIASASVRKASIWDNARILRELRARRKAGLAMNYFAIHKDNRLLTAAISRYFVSFAAALRAVGIDVKALRTGPSTRYESKADIIAALRNRIASGRPVNAGALTNSLLDAAGRHFGSYADAVRAAGIEIIWRTRRSWDRASIVEALRDRRARGLALNPASISKSTKPGSDSKLASAIRKYFPSHDAALRAAGIDPASARWKRPGSDKAAVLAGLRAAAPDGTISFSTLRETNSRLFGAAKARFGTWGAAVRAAGLQSVRRSSNSRSSDPHWTDELVLQTLRELHDEGEDLRFNAMKTRHQPLFFAAKERFGSYVNAVREAGIDYWEMSQRHLAKDRSAAAAAAAAE